MTDYKTTASLLLSELFPLWTSLAGPENRRTLDIISSYTSLSRYSVSSGTRVNTWTIPKEWLPVSASIVHNNTSIVSTSDSHLHLAVNSAPFSGLLDFNELKSHLYTHSSNPKAIPYRTSYYDYNSWAFCVTQEQYRLLEQLDGPFKVDIESSFADGNLDLACSYIPGNSKKEIIFSSYFCHPSSANDSLSGVVLAILLSMYLNSKSSLQYSYRFLFYPETIGSIVYNYIDPSLSSRTLFGYVLTTVAGPSSHFTVKNSHIHDSSSLFYLKQSLDKLNYSYNIKPFDIHGSDERQFSNPNINIDMCTLASLKYYDYEEYHTHLDSLEFISIDRLLDSFTVYCDVIDSIENDLFPTNKLIYGEPFFRDLLSNLPAGGSLLPGTLSSHQMENMLWFLHKSTGKCSLNHICSLLRIPYDEGREICDFLSHHSIINYS